MSPAEAPRGGSQRDLLAELAGLSSRLQEAERYLGIEALRARRDELEPEVSRPDLWDDPERARALSTELGRIGDDIALIEDLGRRLSDAEVLYELMAEASDAAETREAEAELLL
ncbi:MAG: hypothetical protein M0035_10185, partial [Actinomycetota bacterium]|nr:hypothetical protein [Actinomycetota bacterium]